MVATTMVLDVQPTTLTGGGTATVSITGGPANDTVTVQIENADTPPETDSIDVSTDANGNGSATWNVPTTWTWATFSADGGEPISRPIVSPLA